MVGTAIRILTLILGILAAGDILAQEEGFGLGLILGEPTGLSGKWWQNPHRAVDGALAWSFGPDSWLHLHADYLFHNFGLLRIEETVLIAYYGIGGFSRLGNGSNIGLRVPLGIAYSFKTYPLDLFVEIAPLLNLMPRTDFWMNGALGLRYYFGPKTSYRPVNSG